MKNEDLTLNLSNMQMDRWWGVSATRQTGIRNFGLGVIEIVGEIIYYEKKQNGIEISYDF